MFRRMFRKKKTKSTVSKSSTVAASPASLQATIVELHDFIATQEKREEFLHKRMQSVMETAEKRTAMGDKTGAISTLELRETIESEIDKIHDTKINLEIQLINLESAVQNAETFKVLKKISTTMKQTRTEIGIEKIDDIMDDIKEELVFAQEIKEAIRQPIWTHLSDGTCSRS